MRHQLLLHLLRVMSGVALLLWAQNPWLALFAGVVIHLAAFTLAHEIGHASLGVPRRFNELAVALASLPMLVAGHANRLMHQRHHARPLTANDIEGLGAQVPFWKAVVSGPAFAARYRLEALRTNNVRERRWQQAETALTVVLAVAALMTRTTAGAAWVVSNIVMQLTASAWASNLPHRPPRVFLRIANHLLWLPSALVPSFVWHFEHHDRPKVPAMQLSPRLANADEAADEEASALRVERAV